MWKGLLTGERLLVGKRRSGKNRWLSLGWADQMLNTSVQAKNSPAARRQLMIQLPLPYGGLRCSGLGFSRCRYRMYPPSYPTPLSKPPI